MVVASYYKSAFPPPVAAEHQARLVRADYTTSGSAAGESGVGGVAEEIAGVGVEAEGNGHATTQTPQKGGQVDPSTESPGL